MNPWWIGNRAGGDGGKNVNMWAYTRQLLSVERIVYGAPQKSKLARKFYFTCLPAEIMNKEPAQ
jgi:hypothetical protein